jgi:hypothetical protein
MQCSNVVVQGLTILAPVRSPNTDGINPGKHGEIEFASIEYKARTVFHTWYFFIKLKRMPECHSEILNMHVTIELLVL